MEEDPFDSYNPLWQKEAAEEERWKNLSPFARWFEIRVWRIYRFFH